MYQNKKKVSQYIRGTPGELNMFKPEKILRLKPVLVMVGQAKLTWGVS